MWIAVCILFVQTRKKLRYLDEERGKENPTDRRVLLYVTDRGIEFVRNEVTE